MLVGFDYSPVGSMSLLPTGCQKNSKIQGIYPLGFQKMA